MEDFLAKVKKNVLKNDLTFLFTSIQNMKQEKMIFLNWTTYIATL